MTRESLARRLAAWLLTLPGPFAANNEDEALRVAHRTFDASVPFGQFQTAFVGFGYDLRRDAGKYRIACTLDTPRQSRAVGPRIEIMHVAHRRARTIAPQMC
jgi:hypothetical protein